MNSNEICLSIGEWLISFNNQKAESIYSYPGKIDAFAVNDRLNTDFSYTAEAENISKIEIERIEADGILLWNEKIGFHPLFIFWLSDEETYWIQKHKNGDIILVFRVDRQEKRCTLLYDITKTNGRYAFEYFGRIFSYLVLSQGGLVFHGVLMEYQEKGIIICGPSGVGKTTHSRMWRDKKRALIINGDRSLCRKVEGHWTGYGMPWCGTSGEYINRKVSIKAIVVLEQRDDNKIIRLNDMEIIQYMYQHLVVPPWNEKQVHQGLDFLEDMCRDIPVYKLSCKANLEAVDVLETVIDVL